MRAQTKTSIWSNHKNSAERVKTFVDEFIRSEFMQANYAKVADLAKDAAENGAEAAPTPRSSKIGVTPSVPGFTTMPTVVVTVLTVAIDLALRCGPTSIPSKRGMTRMAVSNRRSANMTHYEVTVSGTEG